MQSLTVSQPSTFSIPSTPLLQLPCQLFVVLGHHHASAPDSCTKMPIPNCCQVQIQKRKQYKTTTSPSNSAELDIPAMRVGHKPNVRATTPISTPTRLLRRCKNTDQVGNVLLKAKPRSCFSTHGSTNHWQLGKTDAAGSVLYFDSEIPHKGQIDCNHTGGGGTTTTYFSSILIF